MLNSGLGRRHTLYLGCCVCITFCLYCMWYLTKYQVIFIDNYLYIFRKLYLILVEWSAVENKSIFTSWFLWFDSYTHQVQSEISYTHQVHSEICYPHQVQSNISCPHQVQIEISCTHQVQSEISYSHQV